MLPGSMGAPQAGQTFHPASTGLLQAGHELFKDLPQ